MSRKIVVRRAPFFQIEGVWYADVLWNYYRSLEVDMGRLARFLATAPPWTFVVGRRLSPRQSGNLLERYGDAEQEAFASIFPREHDRWG
jgi:hypothetical protein